MSRNLKFYDGDDPLYGMKLEGGWSEGKNPETKLHIKEEIMKEKEQKPRANISTNPPVGDPPPGQGLYVGRPVGTEQDIGIGHAAGVRTSQKRYPCLSVNMFKMTEIDGYFLVEIGCQKHIVNTVEDTIRIISELIYDYFKKED